MRKSTILSFLFAAVLGIWAFCTSETLQAQGPPPHRPGPVYRRPAPPPPAYRKPQPAPPRHYVAPPPPHHHRPAPPPPPHHHHPAPPPPPHHHHPAPPPTWGEVVGGLIDAAIWESRRP
ncbi:MAG: hypothetical protein IJF17_01095 [Thermoguttaceae bacterium]|nr:hypothetical protein [Thermoguttaceae bacterium]